MASRIINYLGNEQIYNKEKVDELLDDKQDKLEIDKVVSPNSTNPVENKAIAKAIKTLEDKHDADLEEEAKAIKTLEDKHDADLQEEATRRAEGDEELDAKIGDLTSLKTVAKTDVVTAINELHNDLLPIDTALDPDSSHAVENKAVYKGIKGLEDKHDADMQLEADTRKHADDLLEEKHDADMQLEADTRKHADDLLEERIDGIEEKLLPMDEVPMEGSEKPVKSRGIFDAIRFAGVKIGEVMDWPQFKIETRTMISDNPFEFTFNSLVHNVAVEPKDVELEIADNVPEGWRAMDGSVELDAATNQELADFFGGRNTTTDGKIWIPYLPRKIIKVAY